MRLRVLWRKKNFAKTHLSEMQSNAPAKQRPRRRVEKREQPDSHENTHFVKGRFGTFCRNFCAKGGAEYPPFSVKNIGQDLFLGGFELLL